MGCTAASIRRASTRPPPRKTGKNSGTVGRAIKAHTLENLDIYLRMAEENVRKAGGTVFFARDSEEATRYVTELATSRGVKTVVKSKSMVSEEMGLNERLEEAGIESVETDLGEYIIQLAGEAPFHIIAPAIHKSARMSPISL